MTATQASPPTSVPRAAEVGAWWSHMSGRSTVLFAVAEIAIILGVWQLAVGVLGLVHPVFLPPPLDLAEGLGTLLSLPNLSEHLLTSLFAWLVGFGAAVLVGACLGIATGGVLAVERLVGPILWTIYATPWLAYRPLSTIWFGFGIAPIIFLVFISAVFPVLLNTAAGVRAAEPSLLQAGRVFGIGKLGIFRKVLLPSALPFVVVGIRQSAVMATIALIVAEMLGSSVGIGALISITTSRYETQQSFVLIIIAVAWTVGISQLLKQLGRWVAPWQADVRIQ